MPKPDQTEKKAAFEAAKAAHKQATQAYEAAMADAQAQLDAGTLTQEGFQNIADAELVLLKAAHAAFKAAIQSAHGKPAKDKKPKPVAA